MKLSIPPQSFLVPFIIIILGFIVFANCLNNGFVWDDQSYIVSNSELQSPFSLTDIFSKNNIFNSQGQYRPLPNIYFYLLHTLYFNVPYHYHLIQLWVHFVNTFLVYLLFKRFLNKPLSLFLCLIFLIHPIQVESVSYIASADNPLFFLFGISALLLSMSERLNWIRLVSISCLLLIALLTKETAVLFIFLILLYRLIFRKKQKISLLLATAIATIVYAFIRFGLAGVYPTLPNNGYQYIWTQPLNVRLLNIPAIWFYYIKNFFDPGNLGIYQIWVVKQLDFPHFYLPLIFDTVFLIISFSIAWFIASTNKDNLPTLFFFFIWLIVGLLFHSQLFPLDMTVADRWMYLPIVGLLGIFGVSVQSLNIKSDNAKAVGALLAVIIIVLLSLRTINRNNDWKTDFGLNLHDLHINDITSQEEIFSNNPTI